jgi:bifunctional UDP-N-acetylglucosamine pyrophosphorylase/glucosamine-1-phosphate N-acetyltransferase
MIQGLALRDAVTLGPDKAIYPAGGARQAFAGDSPVLLVLAAGKGTRFGPMPKCVQFVNVRPLARHTMDAFREISAGPVICVVGYRWEEVSNALGPDSIYVRSDNPAGGTAYAAFEVFCVAELERTNPLLIITMGDRIVPASILRRIHQTHIAGPAEAALTLLTAHYEPPRQRGKGRILRDSHRKVIGILEQPDIDSIADAGLRETRNALTEGNCPLYAIRARNLRQHLQDLRNDNAQRQYYLTNLIESIRAAEGEIRTVTTSRADPEYELLCADVTRPEDLARLDRLVQRENGDQRCG